MASVTLPPLKIKPIPDALKQRRAFVVWKLEPDKNGRPTKIPYDAKTGKRASSTDAATWATFDEACAKYNKGGYQGIGYVFSEDDPFVGIDFDNCVAKNGTIDPIVKAILERCPGAYAEISPSMKGIKAWVKGSFDGRGRRVGADWNGEIEIYQKDRFFTLTGAQIRGNGTIENCQPGIDAIYEKYFTKNGKAPTRATHTNSVALFSDDQVIERARRAKNGDKFSELFDQGVGEGISESEVDAALIGILAFWTGGDVDQTERILNRSALPRDKWETKRGNETWIRYSIINILAKGGARYKPSRIPTVKIAPATHGLCTSDFDARRFAKMYSRKAKYCAELKNDLGFPPWFLVRPDALWVADNIGIVRQWMLKVRGWILAEANLAAEDTELKDSEDTAKRLAQWAVNLGNYRRVDIALGFAQSIESMYISPKEFDAHPYLFRAGPQTLDLETCEQRPHDSDDLLTQESPVTYDPNAKSTVVNKFIDDITGVTSARKDGDKETLKQAIAFRDYLQRVCGHFLTGRNVLELILVILGFEGTGKTSFANAILKASGDYGMTLDFEAIAKKKNDIDLQPKLKSLKGKRLAVIPEVAENRIIDTALANKIAGGDEIDPRGLHQKNPQKDSFQVGANLVICTNNKFHIPAAEIGLRRKVRVVQFDYQPPEKEIDEQLKYTLLEPEHQRAILAWMVEGYKSWKKDGLREPACVTRWTEDFRGYSNPVIDFLPTFCEPGTPKDFIFNSDMTETFWRWIETEGHKTDIRSIRSLWNVISKQKEYRHIQPGPKNAGRGWYGIEWILKNSDGKDPRHVLKTKWENTITRKTKGPF